MDQSTFNDLCRLLERIEPLKDQRRLKALVSLALLNHQVIGEVQWDGAPAVVVSELIRACLDFDQPTERGETPLCSVLGALRDEGLADGRVKADFDRLRERLGCTSPVVDWPHAPYPGMLALDHTQAPIFFGRTAETADLLARLQTPQGKGLLVVAGASGSGKSSLVRAGLWGTLKDPARTPIAGSAGWVITAMKPSQPSRDPLQNLVYSLGPAGIPGLGDPDQEAAALRGTRAGLAELTGRVLAGRPAGACWLLIVDQFEELFTSIADAERQVFLDTLLLVLGQAGYPRLVITIRSDFLDRCIADPGLRAVFNDCAHYGVGTPGPAAMTEMVEGPVRRRTLARPVRLVDALTNRLVRDADRQPGGLALLAFALKDLYTRCSGQPEPTLGEADYDAIGGLAGVIAQRAREAVARAGVDLDPTLPRVFSRLLTVRLDGEATRRREDLAYWEGDASAQALIRELAGPQARLLVTAGRCETRSAADVLQGRVVEVAHEALFNAWPALAQWIERRREALMLRPRLAQDAAGWAAAGRPDGLKPRPEVVLEQRKLLEGAELWAELVRDAPLIAHFLVRDDAAELLDLTQAARAADTAGSASAAGPDLDPRTALLHTLTGEGREAATLSALVARLRAADPQAPVWLRAGLDQVLAQLADPAQAPRWHSRRTRLGDLLAALGDDRAGVGLRPDGLPDIAWQAVPAGPFHWQDGATRETGAYRIARYPVTNVQYLAFTQVKEAYEDDRWWQEGFAPPEPAKPQWDQPNRPRVELAWVEALAYCRWLTVRLRAAGLIGPAEVIRLPTEYEWEKAARGTDGRDFPWGAGYRSGDANVDETYDRTGPLYLRETTAVGLYPRNCSPYGLMDCAGNCAGSGA
jgi:hypothetical protein